MTTPLSTSRRRLLQGSLVAGVSALFAPSLTVKGMAQAAQAGATSQWKISGSHWGALRARIANGEIAEVIAFEKDKNPTDMLKGIRGLVHNPSRIRYPMVRLDWLRNKEKSDRSQRGDNRFVRVTWDEAIDLFYEELERIQQSYGPSGLYAGATGWRQTGQIHSCGNHMNRAIAMHGSFVSKAGDYSTGAGQVIMPYVLGSTEVYAQGTSWPLILENSKLIVFWANDPIKNLQVGWNCETHESYEYFKQLKEKIANKEIRVISIDPVKSKTQNYLGCEQIQLNPLTDVAFMLAICHTLYTENLHDKAFLETYTLGFERFIPYVLGETEDKIEKTPEWAEKICGVSADTIREFSRLLVKDRSQLMFGWAVQRQQHGEQPYWMGAIIASMIGQIGLAGGGISYSHHYSGIGVPATNAASPGAFPLNPDEGVTPKYTNKDYRGVSAVMPVARWIDALLNPKTVIDYNGSKVTLPGFKMAVFCGCNPWHHHQDHNRMQQAFHALETVVTVDYSWNATCRFSDIVLPACTQFERNDIDVYGAYCTRGILAMQRLVDPLYQSRTDMHIFHELTKRFGKADAYSRKLDEMQWIELLYEECREANKGQYPMPDFAQFWQAGYVDFGEGKNWVRHAEFREDPEINALGTPSGFIEIYSRKIASFNYPDCKGHPIWMEKTERSHGGPLSDTFPIWLQSSHPDQRLHSQMCESDEYRATYSVQGREPIYMNAADAKSRGIKDGDLVRVFNNRGQVLVGVRISDNFPTGVARIHEGGWYAPLSTEKGALDTYGSANTLTLDIGTSRLAQATSANTCLVEIEKFTGKVPPVTAFGGPEIVEI